MDIKINWNSIKKDKIIMELIFFILRHKVSCGESVQQCNSSALDSVNVMAKLVDIIEPEIIDD